MSALYLKRICEVASTGLNQAYLEYWGNLDLQDSSCSLDWAKTARTPSQTPVPWSDSAVRDRECVLARSLEHVHQLVGLYQVCQSHCFWTYEWGKDELISNFGVSIFSDQFQFLTHRLSPPHPFYHVSSFNGTVVLRQFLNQSCTIITKNSPNLNLDGIGLMVFLYERCCSVRNEKLDEDFHVW